jgi:hypothetical protein
MQAGNHSDRAANVIPLFTSATSDATPTRRFAAQARGRVLSKPDAHKTQLGLVNRLNRGHENAWFWEEAALALLGSTGLGAIVIAFRFLG